MSKTVGRKLFIDTNVLLDAAMGERPGWAAATMLIDECAYENVTGYVSALSLKDVYYVLGKYAGEPAAREFILAVMDLFEVVGVDSAVCRMAALSNEPDFEDGLIRVNAESIPVDFIVSRDEGAFKKSSIKRLSAQDYVELFCPAQEVLLR